MLLKWVRLLDGNGPALGVAFLGAALCLGSVAAHGQAAPPPAFGLAAAIPAVVIYNMFARSIAHYRALYADASVEILTLVSRDLSQRPPIQSGGLDHRRAPAAE